MSSTPAITAHSTHVDFPLTPDGYQSALDWLKQLGHDAHHPDRDLETDGYSIVNLVNHFRRQGQ